jgi:hypothetical protein
MIFQDAKTTNQSSKSFLSHPRSFWGSHGEFDQDLSFAFPFGWLLLDALHCRSAVPGREADWAGQIGRFL